MLRRIHRREFERDVGRGLLEGAECLRDDADPRGVLDEAEPQLAMHAICNAPRQTVCRIDARVDVARFIKVCSACRRQLQAAWRALEQRCADGVFKVLDLARDGRLRDVQLLRSGPHAAQLGHSDEIPKMPKLHDGPAQSGRRQ